MISKRWRIRGQVQGVGFRAFAFRAGRGLGVRGGVRNERDGSVTVVAAGAADALAELEVELARGPRFARVDSISAEPVAAGRVDESFDLEF